MRKGLIIVLTFIIGVVIGAAAAIHAQTQPFTITTDTNGKIIHTTRTEPEPTDVKLFVTGYRDGRAVGKLMANVKGRWVEVQLATQNAFAY